MLGILLPCFVVCGIFAGTGAQQLNLNISGYFRQKCYKNSQYPDATHTKLTNDYNGFQNHLRTAFQSIPTEMNVFCEREREQTKTWIKEVAKDLKPCLSQDEQFLPDFLQTSFNEGIHFLCHKDGEFTKRFYDDKCTQKLLEAENGDVAKCFEKIFPPRNGAITKNELCSDINTAKECFKRSLDKFCPNSTNLHQLNDEFFKYISEPCSACSRYLSNLLLTFSLIACYLFSRSK